MKTIIILAVLLLGAIIASPTEGHHKAGHNQGKIRTTLSIVESAPYAFGTDINIIGGEDGQWVRNRCSQEGMLVYDQFQKVVGGISGPFTLGPTPSWVGAGAECEAFLNTVFIEPVKHTNIFYEVAP